jgi:hypothetical protein
MDLCRNLTVLSGSMYVSTSLCVRACLLMSWHRLFSIDTIHPCVLSLNANSLIFSLFSSLLLCIIFIIMLILFHFSFLLLFPCFILNFFFFVNVKNQRILLFLNLF